jgi:type VI secretion system protein
MNRDHQATDLLDALLAPPSSDGAGKRATAHDSLRIHLERLLNSRQGTLTHQPDYGLPDLTEVYLNIPHSLERLAVEVKRCIDAYEPRLENVRIQCEPPTDAAAVIHLDIEGSLPSGERVKLESHFMREGRTTIVE